MNDKKNPTDNDIATDVAYIEPATTTDKVSLEEASTAPKKRGRGRPRKTEVVAKKQGNRGKVGRPKGDAAIMNEYKARMLASPKSRQVLEKIFDAALNDDHKNQGAAWKLVMDRLLPTGMFEQDVTKGNGRNSVNITISGIGGEHVTIGGSDGSKDIEEDGVIDAEYDEYESKDSN